MSARLVGDIGGTYARFALLTADGEPGRTMRLARADYPGIEEAVRDYLRRVEVSALKEACLSVAAPVRGDAVAMTNSPWRFSRAGLRAALGLDRLVVINDFTAQALAIPSLKAAELRQIGGGEGQPDGTVGILGPGTGLGVSALVRSGAVAVALAGEGGHVDLAPGDGEQLDILKALYRRRDHVSAESVLSGGGLVALYQVLCERDGAPVEDLSPPAVIERGAGGACPHCAAALDQFCAFLGAFAGDLALTLGAVGGVYVAGGVVPHFADYLGASRFRARFEAKGRMSDYVAAIPTYLVTASMHALRGAAAALGDARVSGSIDTRA